MKIKGKKILITGYKGMLGQALCRALENEDAKLLLLSRSEIDLADQQQVENWMNKNRPELIFHAAAKVGGIYANSTMPADFLRENLLIQTNIISSAYRTGAEKLIFVASNCTYPKQTPQPIKEDAQLTGPLDENIKSYAISKIAGIELCNAYRKQYACDFSSIIPPNLYGPGDNYHPENSHVVAGLMRRAHEAKIHGAHELTVWGDGSPRRELLYIDDLADAMKCMMISNLEHGLYNVGAGYDLTISEIAQKIADVVGFKGNLIFDRQKPNGTMQKLLDSSRIRKTGWAPKTNESEGLKKAYESFLKHQNTQFKIN